MMVGIKVGEKDAVLFRGDHAPIRICKGSKQLSGWEEATARGQSVTADNTYNDAAHVEILGNAMQDGAPSPDHPVDIVPASGTLTTSCGEKQSTQQIPPLYGIKNANGTWAARDKLVIDDATETAWIERNCAVIESYNGETITSAYYSSTGTLTTGATVVYALATPTIESIDYTAAKTYYPQTVIELTSNLPMDMLVTYKYFGTEDVAGLCVDYQNKTFERLASASGKSAGGDFDSFRMYGGRKRCNVADDGTITAYYGDADYREDGSNGQVMVCQPAFWYKVEPLEYDSNTESGIGYHLRKANYFVSSRAKAGFKLHPAFYDVNGNPVDYILLSAYEGSMYDVSASEFVNDGTNTETAIETGDLLCSVAGKKPISGLKKNLNKVNLESMAQNRGTGWHLETIKAISANQLLMMIELGTMNTQTGIGQGVVSISDNSACNCSSLTGSTASLGSGTGQATSTINEIAGVETTYTTSGKASVTYRGVENPWGNIWKHVQGINIWGDGTMCGGQPYIANDFNFNESKNSDNYEGVGFTLANADGYINAMGYGGEDFDWLMMPSEVGGTSDLPVGDYHYRTTNLNGYRIARLGGYWRYGSNAGGFYWDCTSGVGIRHRGVGGRLLYVPTAAI